MNTILYRLLSRAFQNFWRGTLTGAENLPNAGPAVLVANHLGALGPIAVGASLPVPTYFWIHADMLDPLRAPDYLRRDFVEPQLHIPPPLGPWLASAISKIHIPLLRAVGGIPVHHTPEGFQATFHRTTELLLHGQFLLIFPEDPSQPLDPRCNMRPFYKGFTRLGEPYYEQTRLSLPFVPLAVHATTRTVRVGTPIRYNPTSKPAIERLRLKSLLEHSIHTLLLDAALDQDLRYPIPG